MKRSLIIVLALFTQVWSVSSAQTMGRTGYALLIGIGDYSYSEQINSLLGPANDITN
jgi:hypothetical protein